MKKITLILTILLLALTSSTGVGYYQTSSSLIASFVSPAGEIVTVTHQWFEINHAGSFTVEQYDATGARVYSQLSASASTKPVHAIVSLCREWLMLAVEYEHKVVEVSRWKVSNMGICPGQMFDVYLPVVK